ncbi:MAG: hypothetical protein ABEJ05_12105, partial [Haloglomus sp.]
MADGDEDGGEDSTQPGDAPDGRDEAADSPLDEIDGVDSEADPDPFAALDVDESAAPAGDGDLFTDEQAADLDEEAVWEQLEGDDATGRPLDRDGERAGDGLDRAGETVVEKQSYCERCEHFSEPPEVACTYPDAEIVELVDASRFRVRNCPVVARRRSDDLSGIAGGAAELAAGNDAADSGGERERESRESGGE